MDVKSISGRLPDAVLCDLDGLLVDSEPLWLAAETAVMDALGAPWSTAQAHRFVGNDIAVTAAGLRDAARDATGREHPAVEVYERLVGEFVARVRAGVTVRPGAQELFARLAALGVPYALVTASTRQIVDAVLDGLARLPEPPRFTVTVSADDVTATKPAPEPYLRAAAALGVKPAACVVLEDSPIGVAAGEAAGCAVVAVPGVVDVPPAPGRTVVPSLLNVTEGLLRAVRGARSRPERDGAESLPLRDGPSLAGRLAGPRGSG